MLFRLVRPVKRTGSRYRQFVRRIPSEVRSKATGLKLSIPVGGQAQVVIISPRAQSVRLSLRTDDPAEVKIRLVEVDEANRRRQSSASSACLARAWENGKNL